MAKIKAGDKVLVKTVHFGKIVSRRIETIKNITPGHKIRLSDGQLFKMNGQVVGEMSGTYDQIVKKIEEMH